jgi:hypothetical protein
MGSDMPGYIKQAGFVDVQNYPFDWLLGGGSLTEHLGPQYAEESAKIVMALMKAVIPLALRLGGVEGCRTDEDVQKLLQQAQEQLATRGVYQKAAMCIGRKPL